MCVYAFTSHETGLSLPTINHLLNKLTFDLLTFKVCVRVTCDVGYLCANFNLPRLLRSRATPDVRDRHTDRRQTRIIA